MSGSAETFMTPRRASLISRGGWAGLVVWLFSMALFAFAGGRLHAHGYVTPGLSRLWNSTALGPQSAGQWMTQLLIALVKLVPGSSISMLVAMTILAAAGVQGFIAHDLVKRGWSPFLAALAVGLTGLHPVMLYLATSGAPGLIYAIVASLTIIALDRLEAIGDTQSLIVMGLCVGLLFLTWPNAIFFALPLFLLLPLVLRSGRSISGIGAMFIIIAAPSLIALSAVVIGGALFDVSLAHVFAGWSSVLHGAGLPLIEQSSWLATYGGQPGASFLQLLLICAIVMPRGWVILIRLLTRRAERRQPATGLAALLLPAMAGALATWFWQISSVWSVVATSMLCCFAWAATTPLRRWEQWLWTALILGGVLAGWATPFLWDTPSLETWRTFVLRPI